MAQDQSAKFVSNGTIVHTASYIGQLADSLPWWRVVQGGLYHTDKRILGLRIEKSTRTGEFLNSRTIVTKLTQKLVNEDKKSRASERQEMLKDSIENRRQIGVIVKKDHNDLKVDLPGDEQFALMGFWRITACFILYGKDEKDKLERVWMMRLDKVTLQDIWWRRPEHVHSELPEEGAHDTRAWASCRTCRRQSPIIFSTPAVFLCTNLECESHASASEKDILPHNAVYDQSFLEWRPDMSNLAEPPQYLPQPPSMPRTKDDIDAALKRKPKEHPLWSGYLCSNCEALNLRDHVSNAKCHKCEHTVFDPPPRLSFEEISDPDFLNINEQSRIPNVKISGSTAQMELGQDPDYVVCRWKLHEEMDDYMMVAYPKRHALYAPGGPKDRYDQLTELLVSGKLNYARLPTKAQIKGQLTRWFSQNIGREYLTRMNSSAGNITIAEAHQVHRDVIEHLEKAVSHLTGDSPAFNEVLAMCYFNDMSMGWHADGEEALVRTTVASESLGSTALMSFGVDPKAWVGRNPANKIDATMPIFKGCPKEAERRKLRSDLDHGALTPEAHLDKLRDLLSDVRVSKDPLPCLVFPLSSGAIMVQKGPLVNTHWKHKVELDGPQARLRFVNTARCLSEDVGGGKAKRKRKSEEDE